MADLAVWQRTIVDEEGNVIPGAEIEVRREEDDSLATLYADRAGETTLANPLAADMSGFVRFFAQGDAYTITAVGAGSTRTWRFDPTGRLQEFDRVSEALNTADGADTLETRKQLGTFSTVADVQNSHIPAVLESIRTFGRNAPGDGPPLDLVRGSEIPGAIQSADGQWWEDVGYNTITVKIPTDFATLQEAIDHYSRLSMRQGARIKLLIESGHQPTAGVLVENGDYSRFSLTSVDAEVELDPSFPVGQDIIKGVNARMPTLDCLIDAKGRGGHGYFADQDSHGYVSPGCGVRRCARNACYASAGSIICAEAGVFTEASQETPAYAGILAWASVISANGADASGSLYYGAQAAASGILHFRSGDASGAARHGVRATNLGLVNARGAIANNCGITGFRAFDSGIIHAHESTATGSLSNAYYAEYNAVITARGVIADGVGVFVARAGSRIYADDAVVSATGGVAVASGQSGIVLVNPTADASDNTLRASTGSTITVEGGSVSATGELGRAVHVESGGRVGCYAADLSVSATAPYLASVDGSELDIIGGQHTYSNIAVNILNGSIVRLTGSGIPATDISGMVNEEVRQRGLMWGAS